jgi:hypothetical protein
MTKKRVAVAVVIILALLAGSLYGMYRYYYPLGMSHHCDKVLWSALYEYAGQHGGAFPSGEATPEASMSLVHSLDSYGYEYAYVLRRRDVPEDVVREILKRGELLGPDTCGWNYVEGLRVDSNPRLALFWDKEGLGHNGERLSAGGHIVMFVGGISEYIPEAEWDSFLEEQGKLLAEERARIRNRGPSNRPAPTGSELNDRPAP